MKKKIMLIIAILTTSVLSYSAQGNLSATLDAIEAKYEELVRMEEARKQEFIREKAQLEQEIVELKGKLEGREKIEEKLKKDAEVRWYRNDYKKILNQYETYYKNINKLIAQKTERVEEITLILEVMQ